MGFSSRKEADDFIQARQQYVLGAVHFVTSSTKQLQYIIQSNTSVRVGCPAAAPMPSCPCQQHLPLVTFMQLAVGSHKAACVAGCCWCLTDSPATVLTPADTHVQGLCAEPQ